MLGLLLKGKPQPSQPKHLTTRLCFFTDLWRLEAKRYSSGPSCVWGQAGPDTMERPGSPWALLSQPCELHTGNSPVSIPPQLTKTCAATQKQRTIRCTHSFYDKLPSTGPPHWYTVCQLLSLKTIAVSVCMNIMEQFISFTAKSVIF